MLGYSSTLVAGLASIAGVQALSASCTSQIASFAIGDLGNCLQLTSLLPVLSASGSIISPLNTYLTSLCASTTPTCSNTTLASAQSSLSSGCASDISGVGTNAAEIQALEVLLKNYPEVYAGGCSKNSTNGDFCITDTLTTIQTDTGTNTSVSFLTSLLTGSTSLPQSALSSGNICTGCVQGLYAQAQRANSTISTSSIGSALTQQCGSSFANTAPSGVSSASTGASSTASASASASQPASGALGSGPSAFLPIAIGGISVLFAVTVGGSILL